jgi:serine/threonine protein phosphatase PrpC
MELTYGELSSAGTVRPHNEDYVGFWQPEALEEKRNRGAIAVLADGVGGQGRGEVASRLAVEEALKTFREAKADLAAATVDDRGVQYGQSRGLRQGHGRSRGQPHGHHAGRRHLSQRPCHRRQRGRHARLSRASRGEIKQISTDHSYVAMQRKFGLISDEEAKNSENRSMLTRSVGQEPVIRVDVEDVAVQKGDRIVLCSDGLHSVVRDGEICDIVGRYAPGPACRQLVALAEQRGTEDNVSAQVVQIDEIEAVGYYRGVPMYRKPAEKAVTGEVQAGQLLDDRFFIHEMISRSGMATIYRATDRQTKQMVAIKVPLMQFESDPGFFARFQREEEIGLKLQHPNILKFYPRGQEIAPVHRHGIPAGLHARPPAHQHPPHAGDRRAEACEPHLRRARVSACQAVTHRDLKPQNIMMCYDGTIRLMDFGIARSEGRRITFTGFTPAMGTPDYMAPEQVKGKRGDARTDIYSLGAILYEMITGHPPFEGESPLVIMNARLVGDPVAPRKLNPDISPQVEEIVLHAMERDPADRYQSAAEMKAEIDDPETVTVTGRAERVEAPTPWKQGWRKYQSTIFSFGIPVLVILFFVILLIFHHPAPHR